MEYPPKLRTKKGCWQQQQAEEAPLPIPIQSLSNKPASNSRWFYYTAKLIDGSVLVQKEGDQHFLHRMGCFGKGNLSRGKPEHVHFVSSFQGHQRKTLPATERRFQQSRFQKVRQHRYERHLSWSKLKVLKMEGKEQIDSEGIPNVPSTSRDYQPACIRSKVIEENEAMGDTSWKEDSSSEIEETGEKSTCLHDNLACDVDVSEWTPQVDTSKEGHSSYICDSQEQFLKKETSNLEENISLNMDTSWTDVREEGDHKKGVKRDHTGYVRSQQCESCSSESHPINMSTDIGKLKCLKGIKKGMGTGDIRCSSDDDCRMKKDKQLEQQSRVSKSDTELTQFKVLDESNVPGHQQTKLRDSEPDETQNQKSHRQEEKEKTPKMKSKQVIRKPDPYPVQEFLQLSYEESFFLSYGLGCLTLLKPSTTSAEETPMNLVDIWKEFLILKPRFPATYACYHYYRSKGWVPRCGIKYGCDFVVYKKGPSFYHSSFAVLAHLVEEGSEMTSALASWYNFTGFSRIIENAAKDVILCYVTYPEEFTELHLKSPACIPHLKVHEICMKRWRPTREREWKEDYPP